MRYSSEFGISVNSLSLYSVMVFCLLILLQTEILTLSLISIKISFQ